MRIGRKMRDMNLYNRFRRLLNSTSQIDRKSQLSNMTPEEYNEWKRKEWKGFKKKYFLVFILLFLFLTVVGGFLLYMECMRAFSFSFNREFGKIERTLKFEGEAELPYNYIKIKDIMFEEGKMLVQKFVITALLSFIILCLFTLCVLHISLAGFDKISDRIERYVEKRLSFTNSFKKKRQMATIQYGSKNQKIVLIVLITICSGMILKGLKIHSVVEMSSIILIAIIGITILMLYFSYNIIKIAKEYRFGVQGTKKYLQLNFMGAIITILSFLFFIYIVGPLIFLFGYLESKILDVVFKWYVVKSFMKLDSNFTRLGFSPTKTEIQNCPRLLM